ncbi:MAG: hypothetical protein KHX03_06320 [Clostridium sp.]|nr:hypothetical protein [Clostridium sp.]
MKKVIFPFIFIFFILILLSDVSDKYIIYEINDIQNVNAEIKKFDLNETFKSQNTAIDIMYNYLSEDTKKYKFEKDNKKTFFEIDKEIIQAFEYDLNNDGITEIIGVYPHQPYCGLETCNIFILKKGILGYKNIFASQVLGIPYKISISKQENKSYNQINIFTHYQKDIVNKLKFTNI